MFRLYKENPMGLPNVAYFSMEIAIDQSIATYSGGLGFLAGSHMLSAGYLQMPMVGVTILWSYGYYNQRIDHDGNVEVAYIRKHYDFLTDINESVNVEIYGEGNGPIDAFVNALKSVGIKGFEVMSYKEHSISSGSDSKAICYMQMKKPDGKTIFGVGISHGIFKASARSLLCAINRSDCEVRVNGEII